MLAVLEVCPRGAVLEKVESEGERSEEKALEGFSVFNLQLDCGIAQGRAALFQLIRYHVHVER